jgi:hypothetical protein
MLANLIKGGMKMKKTRYLFFPLIFIFIGMFNVNNVFAVPNPNAISWKAEPQAFVRSLYVGVLGRQAESNAVVVAWARQVGKSPSTRRALFWRFVQSPEYQKSRWAKQRKEYKIYYKWNKSRTTTWTRTWWVSKNLNSASYRYHSGPFTFGVAKALRNYYADYYPR